jgi:outer membrane protein TolC
MRLILSRLSALLLPALLVATVSAGEKKPLLKEDGRKELKSSIPKPVAVGLTVEDCLTITLRNNISLRRQQMSDDQAGLDLRSAAAEFLPSLSASSSLNRTDDGLGGPNSYTRSGSATLSGKTPWSTSYSASASQSRTRDGGSLSSSSTLSAELRQPLLYGGGAANSFYGYRSALRQRAASRLDLQRQRQATVYETKRLYWAALRNKLELETSRRSLKSADYFLKATQARVQAKQASRLDVSNAEIQRSNREVALINAEAALEGSLDDLKIQMDLPLTEAINLTSSPAYQAGKIDETGLLAMVLGRPDLVASRRRLEVKTLDLARQRRNAWPTLDLVASHSISGDGASTDASHSYRSGTSQLSLELNLPLGMVKRRNDLRHKQLELRREKLSLHSKEVSARRQLRSALRDLRAAERNLASFSKRVEAARLAAAAAAALYSRGKASSFDAIRAEDELLDAELGLLRSQANCLTRQANLDLVIGRDRTSPEKTSTVKPKGP